MIPWFMLWAPQITFPYGGNVHQKIEPDTNWFFGTIPSGSGDAKIEKKAFEVASYGRQLGLITELLLDMANDHEPSSERGKEALRRLDEIKTKIDNLKKENAESDLAAFTEMVEKMKKHPEKLAEARKIFDMHFNHDVKKGN